MSDTGLSLEQLTERSGVDVDQLGQWLAMQLVRPGPDGRFDADAVERVRLIRFAVSRGIDPEDIVRLSEAQGSDVLARYIEFLGGPRPPGRSLEEAARLAGLPEELARRYWIAGGLADDEVFDSDLEMMRAGATALDLGLPEEALLQIIRVLADALTRVADAENRLFHFYVHEQLKGAGLSGSELVDTVRAVSEPLIELVEPSILYFHRRAWSRAVLEDMVLHLREDLAPDKAEVGQMSVAVLFVDLASFTPLTEAMGDVEAAKVLDRFSDLVRESAGHCDGRVLKQIGDEFMVVFPSAGAAVRCGVDIAQRVGREAQFPALRMGAHSGTALYREADYLGATVNIAARVASEAGRGQFLVTEVSRAEAETLDGVSYESLGRRQLKGVAEALELFEVRHVESGSRRVIDAVCGMELDPEACDVRLSWRGRELCFCSQACRDQFVEAPERYEVP